MLETPDLAACIDHTLLKPEASAFAIEQLCREAAEHGFASVCVMPTWVDLAHTLLEDSEVAVCTVIGFPLGAHLTKTKVFEAQAALSDGADELDMVMNIGAFKSTQPDQVTEDIAAIKAIAGDRIVKVILETCLLTDEEKVLACELCVAAGADFVKTSTGFAGGGATIADVRLMRSIVGPDLGVKASGGVRSRAHAMTMLEAGATRIGTSAGIAIVSDDADTGANNY